MKQAYYTLNINNIQENINSNENISLFNNQQAVYINLAFAKSEAEPRNSNYEETLANISTPLNYRAFFVRSIRTPKERYNLARSSMVACSGKGSPFAVFQSSQFSSPLHAIAQTLESLAIASKILTLELSAMIYKFLTLGKNRLKISILANSEKEARSKICFSSQAVLVARLPIPHQIAKFPQNLTACTAQGGIYA